MFPVINGTLCSMIIIHIHIIIFSHILMCIRGYGHQACIITGGANMSTLDGLIYLAIPCQTIENVFCTLCNCLDSKYYRFWQNLAEFQKSCD